jgi:hypothetical protein
MSKVWSLIAGQPLIPGSSVSVQRVCEACVATLWVDGAGLTVSRDTGGAELVFATDPRTERLEELQITLGEGPCVDAFSSGGPVLASELDALTSRSRWPAFAPAAVQSGARAEFAFPLHVGAIRVGWMDLYRAEPGSLKPDDLADALAFADAALMVVLDGHLARAAALDEGTHDGNGDGNFEVHQATGMLSVQLGVSIEDAYVRLRAYAYARDLRLAAVAGAVITRRLRFIPEPDGS